MRSNYHFYFKLRFIFEKVGCKSLCLEEKSEIIQMGTESIFKSFLVLHRNFWECHHFKLGGVTALFSHMVGMNSLAATASHSHMGGARIQLWSSPSEVFFIINRKVILSACLRMFMETCDFYLQNSFLRVHANQTIE